MTKSNHVINVRQGIKAALLVGLVFAIAQSATAQWASSGTNINNTNTGNVGIGTTTPQSTLHIATGAQGTARGLTLDQNSSDTASSALALRKSRGTTIAPQAVVNGDGLGYLDQFAFDGSAYINAGRIKFFADGPVAVGSVPAGISFQTSGWVERMRISSAGNVGIGTASPSYLLDVTGSTNTPFRVRDSSNREYFSTTTRTGSFGTTPIVNLGGSRLIIDSDGPEGGNSTILRRVVNHFIFPPSDNPGFPGAIIISQVGGASALFIDQHTNGNIGIGTGGPSFKLDVQGGQINASGGFCIAGDCKTAWSQVSGGGSSQWTTAGANISYSSGSVGVGTTSPSYLLDVTGSTNTPFRVRDSSSREYFSTTTRTGTYGTAPIVSLGGGRLIIDANTPEGGNNSVLRRVINSLVIPPSDNPAYPGVLAVTQPDGSSILYVDQNPGGKIGVGTSGPSFKLDVQGGQINSSGGLCIAGDCKTAWSQVGGQWATSATNISYSAGNVGIGTTTAPSSRLEVNGDMTVSGTGNISAVGTISGGNVIAKYQDIAEWVAAHNPMPAGTVVVLDIERSNQVTASQQAYDTRVAGVISGSPGIILGQAAPGKVMVATTGRVRIKVDATRAPIRAGDLLVTSDKEGTAMKSEPLDLGGAKIHRPGTIIGKAIEPLPNGIGEILVLLSLQ